MRIKIADVIGFRLLENFSIDLNDNLSLIVGHNNAGKTSLLAVLEKFIDYSTSSFTFDDFNIKARQKFKSIFEADDLQFETYESPLSIILTITIQYDDTDNLEHISRLMTNLDPEDNEIHLRFQYSLSWEKYLALREDFVEKQRQSSSSNADTREESCEFDILNYLHRNHGQYFQITRTSFNPDNSLEDISIEKEDISRVIRIQSIKAKRDVDNSASPRNGGKTLSRLSSQYYSQLQKQEPNQQLIRLLEHAAEEVDGILSETYQSIFAQITGRIHEFSGINEDATEIGIFSDVLEGGLLKENTTVRYKQSDAFLPEDYNGLGYLNLIAMIFEIEMKVQEFRNIQSQSAADINLFFIEEPEAHTHPQMQYIFIRNVKKLLSELAEGDSEHRPIALQTIITTHSSHIASQSDFNDIKYFVRIGDGVESKNLSQLEEDYGSKPAELRFLKQYLTLTRAELFFADKAILIEGDTERILMTAFMKRIDIEDRKKSPADTDLLSQNISVVETGAYSHIFDYFLRFLGIKTLVITDLDACGNQNTKAKVEIGSGQKTSNASIQYYLDGCKDIDTLSAKPEEDRQLKCIDNEWKPAQPAKLFICYQEKENEYQARSFEDAFIHVNLDEICKHKDDFTGLINKRLLGACNDAYELADQCVGKKTAFAMDILFFANDDFSNWKIPCYIEKGLRWLKKN